MIYQAAATGRRFFEDENAGERAAMSNNESQLRYGIFFCAGGGVRREYVADVVPPHKAVK